MGDQKDNRDPSFEAFMETVLGKVATVNNACQSIGSNGVLRDTSKEWKDYKRALDDLQDTIKSGQHDGNGKHAVKNCICEFVYEENLGGGDQQPLRIKAVRLRGWVKVSPAAEEEYSSNSSSSSASSGGGG